MIGEVTAASAKEFGLAPGTLIAAGAGDTAANALGAGIVEPGMLFDVAGTAAVLAGCTDTFVADTKNRALLTMRSVIPGCGIRWPISVAAGWLCAGSAISSTTLPGEKHSRWNEDLYPEMIALAAAIPPGSDGLFFSPHLGGRICPSSPDMRGAWIGVSWSHTQAHFFRAMLESVAFEYAYYLRILRELLPSQKLVRSPRGGRWRPQPGVEPDQGGCAGNPLPVAERQRIRHLGRGHDRRESCRGDR